MNFKISTYWTIFVFNRKTFFAYQFQYCSQSQWQFCHVTLLDFCILLQQNIFSSNKQLEPDHQAPKLFYFSYLKAFLCLNVVDFCEIFAFYYHIIILAVLVYKKIRGVFSCPPAAWMHKLHLMCIIAGFAQLKWLAQVLITFAASNWLWTKLSYDKQHPTSYT